jgi:tetratricopeptide (TPR) repeat protein
MDKANGPKEYFLIPIIDNLATISSILADHEKSELLVSQSLELRRAAFGEGDEVASGLKNLAELFYERGQYDDADRLLQEALAAGRTDAVKDEIHLALAQVYEKRGELDRAEEAFEQISEPLAARPSTAASYQHFSAKMLIAKGEYAVAEQLLTKAFNKLENAIGPNEINRSVYGLDLGVLYIRSGKYSSAERRINQALDIQKKYLGENHPYVARTLNVYADLLRKTSRESEASAAEQRARRILEDREAQNRTR